MKFLKPNIDLTQYGFTHCPSGWRYDITDVLSILITEGKVLIWSCIEQDMEKTHDNRWLDIEHIADVPKVLFDMYKDGVVGWNE